MLEGIYRASGFAHRAVHLAATWFLSRTDSDQSPVDSENEVVRLVAELQPLLKSISGRPSPDVFRSRHGHGIEILRGAEMWFGDLGKPALAGGSTPQTSSRPWPVSSHNIAFDHEQWLGGHARKDRRRKSRIIKPENSVRGRQRMSRRRLRSFEKVARERNAPLINVGTGVAPVSN